MKTLPINITLDEFKRRLNRMIDDIQNKAKGKELFIDEDEDSTLRIVTKTNSKRTYDYEYNGEKFIMEDWITFQILLDKKYDD